MRKITNLFLALGVIAMMGVATSCEDTNTNPPVIEFLNGVNETTLDAGVTSYTIAGNISSDAGLDEVKLFKVTNAGETQMNDAITKFNDKNSFDFQFQITGISEDLTIKVQATDKDNLTASKNFMIHFTSGSTMTVETFPNITLDNYPNGPSTGTSHKLFLDLLTGDKYSQSELEADASLKDAIDVYFFRHSQFKSTDYPDFTIRSANNTGLKDLYDTYQNYQPVYVPADMNNTKVGIVDVSDWNSLDVATIESLAGSVSNSATADLDAGYFVAFETSSGNQGVIKVESVTPGDTYLSSTITVSVKVIK